MEAQILKTITLVLLVMPLLAVIMQRQFTTILDRRSINCIVIGLLSITFGLSSYILYGFIVENWQAIDLTLYVWGQVINKSMQVGFLIDSLSALMLTVISCVALVVHIYSMYYMQDDSSYARFFSYISFFTFAMLILVLSNNFLQLFFAWEMVGLASYLLIGFWFTNETAVRAGFKAFLINRIGDVGLFLGILVIFYCYQSFNYGEIFSQVALVTKVQSIAITSEMRSSALNVICVLLLIGALGKSAQIPLHTWLPDSMAGPLPVSALIHAATMVTAGIFMIARVMPLYAHSAIALDLMLMIGSITCISMGLVAIVQYDVKQVLAYSTISQLGLMLVALGTSSAFAAISHLVMHAFFKALLFLNAGIVIKVCHDQQDLRKMGGLHVHMPFNYWIMLIASLAAIGVPGLSGFYSKELILASINLPNIYYLILFSIFITTVYTLRMFFLIFYGTNCAQMVNLKQATKSWLVKVPLIVLVIPVITLGWFSEGAWSKMLHGFISLPFLLIILGSIITWQCYGKDTRLTAIFTKIFISINFILINKYWFEKINMGVIYIGKQIGNGCFQLIDRFIIENVIINGSVKCINKFSNIIRMLQTGYLYHYLLIMLIGLTLLLYTLLLGIYGYY